MSVNKFRDITTMKSHSFLPGIKSIYYVPCSSLPASLMLKALSDLPITLTTGLEPIPFADEPTCESEGANTNNGPAEQVTLTFQSLMVIPEDIPIAFALTDVNGQSYVIGTKEQPYPLITCRQSFGSPSGDAHSLGVEVAFTAPMALIACEIVL